MKLRGPSSRPTATPLATSPPALPTGSVLNPPGCGVHRAGTPPPLPSDAPHTGDPGPALHTLPRSVWCPRSRQHPLVWGAGRRLCCADTPGSCLSKATPMPSGGPFQQLLSGEPLTVSKTTPQNPHLAKRNGERLPFTEVRLGSAPPALGLVHAQMCRPERGVQGGRPVASMRFGGADL